MLGGASLPTLAFYSSSSGDLLATTPITSPRNLSFFAGGAFWILANHQFQRIDAATHAITWAVDIPIDEPNGFTWDDDYIWITDLSAPRVYRVDQRTGTSTHFDFGKDDQDIASATDIAVGADSVWLARPDNQEIVQLDRATGKVLAYLPINAWGMSFGADALWFWHDGYIGRLDPQTLQQSFDPSKLTDESGLGNIYFAGGDAWTSSADLGLVYRVDRSGRSTTYRLHTGVGEMAPTTTTMWVTNAESAELTGIDIATGQVDRTIDTGHATLAAAASGDEIMVAVGPTVDEVVATLPGSVLNIATDGFPWWDPAPDPPLAGNWQVQQGLYITCANLLTYPDKPGNDGLQLIPEVATSMPDVSADGRTYSFTIRPDFRFSPPLDEPVTAQTFVNSLERAVNPVLGDGDPGPNMFSDVEGVAEYRAGTADHVSGIVATGDKLSITLVAPAPDFPMRLASPFACPVPQTGTPVLRSGLKPDVPVGGAGPYYLSQMVRKRLVVFSKNPNYRGPRAQPFDEIAVRLQVAPSTAVGMVRDGTIDAVMLAPGDPQTGAQSGLDTEWGPASANAEAGDQRWFGAPRHSVDTLLLNPTRAPFNDPDVRRAVSLALDRAALARIWVDQPAGSLLVPGVQGTDGVAAAVEPDVSTALALMKGRSLKATMIGFPEEWDCGPCQDFDVEVTKQLKQIGIDVTIRQPDDGNYPGDGVFDQGSDVDLLPWGSGVDIPDAADLLGGLQDVSWLGKDILDQLTALQQASGPDRVAGMVALGKKLSDDDNVVLPIGYGVYPFFISDRIGCGFVQSAVGAVDLLSLCVKDASNASPASSPSP